MGQNYDFLKIFNDPFRLADRVTFHLEPECATGFLSLFHSGIIKLQQNSPASLSQAERLAVSKLRLGPVQDEEEEVDDGDIDIMVQLQKQQKSAASSVGGYANANFVLGSCAEIERLWSVGEPIMCKTRFSMTPYLFEALIFLKYNRKYWNKELVVQAMRLVDDSRRQHVRFQQEQEALDILVRVDDDDSDDERFE
jgi:hypothetical protein